MSRNTKIEWTDDTWNPLRAKRRADGKIGWHCEKVSEACDHCYAETHNGRGLPNGGTGFPYVRSSRDRIESFIDSNVLMEPFGWKRPRKIFVESMSDLFAEWVTDEEIARVFAVAFHCRQHTFQMLTKRAVRMAQFLKKPYCRTWIAGAAYELLLERSPEMEGIVSLKEIHDEVYDLWPFRNVWLGVTAESERWGAVRIPALLACPAAVRWVSYEPALSLIEWTRYGRTPNARLDWIVCGGESGAGARAIAPDWARYCRDYCQWAGVAFFFKQWGAWQPIGTTDGRQELPFGHMQYDVETKQGFKHVGKEKAGRVLDGREWSEFPQVAV